MTLSARCLNSQVDQHADLAAHVDIGDVDTLGVTYEAADLDVLADGQNLVGGHVGHSAVGAGVGAGLQSLHVSGVLSGNQVGQVLHEVLEDLVLSHEVGLRVDLDDHAHAVVGHDA